MSDQHQQDDRRVFLAVWHALCWLTPRRRSQVAAPNHHTIAIAPIHPSTRLAEAPPGAAAFWVYIDGYTSHVLASSFGTWRVERWKRLGQPFFAPAEEMLLFAMTAAHVLCYPSVERAWPLPLALQGEQEDAIRGTYQVQVPNGPGSLPVAYVLQTKKCQVTIGSRSCGMVRAHYRHEALWYRGQCWEAPAENWCYFPAALSGIDVYGRPPRMRL